MDNCLAFIEAALAQRGLKHVQDTKEPGEAKEVRCFGFYHQSVGCKIYQEPAKIRLVLWEFGRLRSSDDAITLRKELGESFTKQFGTDKVKFDD